MSSTSKRSGEIKPFQVMAILAEAQALQAAGHDIIHLEVGEPDFTTPDPVTEAGIAAARPIEASVSKRLPPISEDLGRILLFCRKLGYQLHQGNSP